MRIASAMCLLSGFSALLSLLRVRPDAVLACLFLVAAILIKCVQATRWIWRPWLVRLLCRGVGHVWHRDFYLQRCTRCRASRWVIP